METITCETFRALLPSYRAGSECREIREAVEAHMQGCPGCREEAARLDRQQRRDERHDLLRALAVFGVILAIVATGLVLASVVIGK